MNGLSFELSSGKVEILPVHSSSDSPAGSDSNASSPSTTFSPSQIRCLLEDKIRRLQKSYDRWNPLAISQLKPQYEQIAEALCKQATSVHIAAITGSSIAAVGGATACITGGLALIGPTFGLSVLVAAILASISLSAIGTGIAATCVSGGALVADAILGEKIIDRIADLEKQVIDAATLMCDALKELVEFFQQELIRLQETSLRETTNNETSGPRGGARTVNTTLEITVNSTILAGKTILSTSGHVAVKTAGAAAGCIFVGLDIYQIVKSSRILKKKKEERSSVAQKLREQAKQLEELDDCVHSTLQEALAIQGLIG